MLFDMKLGKSFLSQNTIPFFSMHRTYFAHIIKTTAIFCDTGKRMGAGKKVRLSLIKIFSVIQNENIMKHLSDGGVCSLFLLRYYCWWGWPIKEIGSKSVLHKTKLEITDFISWNKMVAAHFFSFHQKYAERKVFLASAVMLYIASEQMSLFETPASRIKQKRWYNFCRFGCHSFSSWTKQ